MNTHSRRASPDHHETQRAFTGRAIFAHYNNTKFGCPCVPGGGSAFEHFIPAQKGDPRNPLSAEELAAKFRSNAAGVLPQQNAERLIAAVRSIETVPDVGAVCNLC